MNFNISKTNKILQWIIAFLLAFLILATIIILFVKGPRATENYRIADPEPAKVVNYSSKTSDKVDAFTQLKQIRTHTKAENQQGFGTTVVISAWFTYPSGDKTFYEELSQKERMEESIITEYFTRYTEDELRQKGEKKIKEELLQELNENLVLGQIRTLYFDEYMFIR